MKGFILLMLSCYINLLADGQKKITLSSPDNNIRFEFTVSKSSPQYSVSYLGSNIIEKSDLNLRVDTVLFSGDLLMLPPVFREADEIYTLNVGKTKNVKEHYREVEIPLVQKKSPFRQVNFIVRAFNDGIAFRYRFLPTKNDSTIVLTEENSSFRFIGDPLAHALLLPNYTSSHEGYYTGLPLSKIKADELMDMPALFELPGGVFAAITEANLLDYAGMYLSKHNGVLVSRLSPLPGQTTIKVKASLPHVSPWRVIMISNRIGAIMESNLITNLAESCRITDVSWIRPGKSTFPWWNGNVVPDTINAPGNNFVTNQYYIDFCARNNIEYHSVVEYGLHQWYMDDGIGFAPGPHSDVTTPVPGLDMKEICDYAAKKGVGVRVWVHWAALYPKLDSAFTLFEKWGLKGMMVDFMDRDDQQMVNIQTEILEKAAKHHLHIQFHGAYKPTGLQRTYPNEFTREGTLNYETNKWGPALPPDHDIMMPFTRVLAGATDYHLGGFRAVTKEDYRTQYTRPLMGGTRCHMLAMYVVLESWLAMVCDYPEAYEGEPGFDFIKQVPTDWDETKIPAAKIGEYVVTARRSKNDWFIGSINNHEARKLEVPLNFLGEGNYRADIYSDAEDVSVNPNHINVLNKTYTAKDTITFQLAGGGGAAVHFRKI